MNDRLTFDEAYIRATREAEQGIGTCRDCSKKGPFQDFIAVLYGGGVLYSMCLGCAERGNQLMVRRGGRGVEVLRRAATGPAAVGAIGGLGAIKTRL